MVTDTPGIHHVTAMVGDPQPNLEFYAGVLGLRLVKRTVNHDDTRTYHLYFGDGAGTPGTAMTVFPWGADGREGTVGTGQVHTTRFAVPPGSLAYWADRLDEAGVAVEWGSDGEYLAFEDPDGLPLELVAEETDYGERWAASPVPAEHQIRRLQGVELALRETETTAALLNDMGFESRDDRQRFVAPGPYGRVVDLTAPDIDPGVGGVGTVHHVAFVAEDRAQQSHWRTLARQHGLRATEVIDRTYFESVYFRTDGGVLFEMATPAPGFTVDEDREALGERLALPEWLADQREEIETALPAIEDPVGDA